MPRTFASIFSAEETTDAGWETRGLVVDDIVGSSTVVAGMIEGVRTGIGDADHRHLVAAAEPLQVAIP